MIELNGSHLDGLGFNPVKLGDLLWHEGPLLSHYMDLERPADHYFYKWSDCDTTAHRWMIFQVTETGLQNFFEKGLTLREMILKNNFVYFLDLDGKFQQLQLLLATTNNIPTDYMPDIDSGYDEIGFEAYAQALRETVKKRRPKFKDFQKYWLGKAAL